LHKDVVDKAFDLTTFTAILPALESL